MTETTNAPIAKWWGDSLTIRGALLSAGCTVLPVLGPLIGISITAETIGQVAQQAGVAVQAIGGLAGAAMAIFGRVRATQPLTRRTMEVKI